MPFRVMDASTGEQLPGFPSPYLIEQGEGYAYTLNGGDERPYWYAKVPGRYESPDGTYAKVKIVHTDDWKVSVRVEVTDPRFPEEYDDYFIVEASDRRDAEARGHAVAKDDVARRYGEDAVFDVRVLHTREGVSI